MTIVELEHELGIAGHEDGCAECGRAEARKKLEWTLAIGRKRGILTASEQRQITDALRDPKILDDLASRWGMLP